MIFKDNASLVLAEVRLLKVALESVHRLGCKEKRVTNSERRHSVSKNQPSRKNT
jgi:hypothetical protein